MILLDSSSLQTLVPTLVLAPSLKVLRYELTLTAIAIVIIVGLVHTLLALFLGMILYSVYPHTLSQ